MDNSRAQTLQNAAARARANNEQGLFVLEMGDDMDWLVGKTVEVFKSANLLTKIFANQLKPDYDRAVGVVTRVARLNFVVKNEKGSFKCLWPQFVRVM